MEISLEALRLYYNTVVTGHWNGWNRWDNTRHKVPDGTNSVNGQWNGWNQTDNASDTVPNRTSVKGLWNSWNDSDVTDVASNGTSTLSSTILASPSSSSYSSHSFTAASTIASYQHSFLYSSLAANTTAGTWSNVTKTPPTSNYTLTSTTATYALQSVSVTLNATTSRNVLPTDPAIYNLSPVDFISISDVLIKPNKVPMSSGENNLDYLRENATTLLSNYVSSSPATAPSNFAGTTVKMDNITAYSLNDTCEWKPEDTNFWALFAILLILAGFAGNMLVCLAISTERRLQTPTNYFLLSLAVADLLVSVLVMPLGISMEIAGGVWPFNFAFCVLYAFSDVMGCTASIMHMCFISIDRYLGISKPLEQRNRSKSVVGLKILGVWIISFAISSPVVFVAIFNPLNVLPTPCLCTMDNQYIMVYGSLSAFFLPLTVMCFMMYFTARLLKTQAKWSEGKREAGGGGGGPRMRTVIKRHPGAPPPPPKTRVRYRSDSTASTNQRRSNGNVSMSPDGFRQPEESSTSESPDDQPANSNSPTRNSKGTGKMETAVGIFHRRRQKKLSAQKVDSEKKATKVLAIVFVLFCICWVPFFLTTMYVGVCLHAELPCPMPPDWIYKVWLWLGWASSTVNPMIYTVVNPNFRQAFKRLLGWNHLGQRCRRQVDRTVQTYREWSTSNTPPTGKRGLFTAIKQAPPSANRGVCWSPTFLIALELDNETPV